MNSIRYLHLIIGLVALLTGLFFSVPLFTQVGPINLTALTVLFLGLINMQQFNNALMPATAGRRIASVIAGVLLIIATLTPLAVLFGAPAAGSLMIYALALAIAGVCISTILVLTKQLARHGSDHDYDDEDFGDEDDREAGTVKWFNTSKGFGFISRDQGEDVFVHFRAIRGDGHRVLVEGQRVEFVVARREKGLQAEDVTIID